MIRKLAYYFVMAGLILMCMSCQFEEDQMGYPRTVTFPKEGGEIIVKGQSYSGELYIGRHWDSDAFSYAKDGYETVRYKWLTAKSPSFDYTPILIIVAEPNTSGKSRMLRIFVYSGYQYATIEVKQE